MNYRIIEIVVIVVMFAYAKENPLRIRIGRICEASVISLASIQNHIQYETAEIHMKRTAHSSGRKCEWKALIYDRLSPERRPLADGLLIIVGYLPSHQEK